MAHKINHPHFFFALYYVGKDKETGSTKHQCTCLIVKDNHFVPMSKQDYAIFDQTGFIQQFVTCGTCGKSYFVEYSNDSYQSTAVTTEQTDKANGDYLNDNKN